MKLSILLFLPFFKLTLQDPELGFEVIDLNKTEAEVVLTDKDFKRGEELRLRNITAQFLPNTSLSQDATLSSGKFEGDIDGIDENTLRRWDDDRNAIRSEYGLWPDGEVPFAISSFFGDDAKGVIAQAVAEFHSRTCLRFKPRTDETNYLYIFPGYGCYSMVGRNGGRQVLSLGQGCVHKGVVIHELMHAIGFFHEQSRADRDDYVRINRENIMPRGFGQFQKYGLELIQHLGAAYDYGSIMHYGPYAFGKYGEKEGYETITALIPEGQEMMGNRRDFSDIDLYKVNKLYSCQNTGGTRGPPPRTSTTEPTPNDCTDDIGDCANRKRYNYCSYDRDTLRYCRKTCELCTPATTATSHIAGTTASSVCEDLEHDCDPWASHGYCEKHQDFMAEHCRKACGWCGHLEHQQ